MQKTDQFISNGMAVQSTEIQDIELLTAEMFARQISDLSAHGMYYTAVHLQAPLIIKTLLCWANVTFLAKRANAFCAFRLQNIGGTHQLNKLCVWGGDLNGTIYYIRRFHAAAILKSKARLRWEETRK